MDTIRDMTIRILEDGPLSDRETEKYDHAALAAEAMKHPGCWVTDDDENVPQVTSTHIRQARLVDYRPAGAFTTRRRTVEGRQRFDIRFIGVPIEPWLPPHLGGDGRAFNDLQRTLDPRKMPEGTPEHVVQIAQDLLDAVTGGAEAKPHKKHKAATDDESKPEKKKGKKKKAKKHKS